jgi:hypothetical protein
MRNYYFIVLFLALQQFSLAQGPGYIWSQKYGGNSPSNVDAMTTDTANNIYVTGITSAAYFVKKLSPAGTLIWNRAVPAEQITVDASMNVYIIASFTGTLDADPGPGVLTFTSQGGSRDILVSKLDVNGNLVWAKQVTGSGLDIGNFIALDVSGNIYTCGSFTGIIDLDPGIGVSSYTATGTHRHGYLCKMDPQGNFIWAREFQSTSTCNTYAMDIDNSGNLYLAGVFTDSADLDPGPAVDTHTTTSINDNDVFLCKFDLAGNLAWVKEIENSGNNSFSAPVIGSTGNIFMTGSFTGTLDVDPGPAVYNLTATSSYYSFYITEWNPSGNMVWAVAVEGSGTAYAKLKLDAQDNIYLAGSFYGTVDFDPGPGTAALTATNNFSQLNDDIWFGKWGPTGALKWVRSLGDVGIDYAQDLVVDQNYNVCIGGRFKGTVDFDPGPATANLTWVGSAFANYDVFVAKYCTTPDQPGLIMGNTNICAGASVVFSIAPLPNTQTYTWTLPSGWSGSSTTVSIPATAGANGLITVKAANACGAGAASTLSLTTVPVLSVSASQNSVCAGKNVTLTAVGAATFAWSNGMTGSVISFSPPVSAGYTVTGTSTAGCTNTAIQQIMVVALPTISVSASQSTLCAGKEATLIATGAVSYLWSDASLGNSITVSPSTSNGYTVTGTSAAGCTNTAVQQITVITSPTVSISAPSFTICVGEGITLNAGGAATYSWSNSMTGNVITFTPSLSDSYTVTGTNAEGCTNTEVRQVTVDNCTGVSEMDQGEFKLYPNPSSGLVKMNSEKTGVVRIFSVSGICVSDFNHAQNESVLDLSGLTEGVYFIYFENAVHPQKLVLMK